jgi:DNA-binding transcriptional regulator YdaS (Cro superfamily)
VDVAANNFAFALIRASQALGSLLDVAQLLGVEPKQVYLWIADVEAPTAEQRSELETKLGNFAAAR